MKRTSAFVPLAALASLLFLPVLLWARLPIPEGTEDLCQLGNSAEFIFHAAVVSLEVSPAKVGPIPATANLLVDRWYKGKPQTAKVRLKFFSSSELGQDGHHCIDLQRTDSWLIFANQVSPGVFEFSHDCMGGLPMSALLVPFVPGAWPERLQRDLIFGLSDTNPSVRLANIARLGGLKMPSSAEPLQRFIAAGTETESKWALYAALRSGDLNVLPRVESIVIGLDEPPHNGRATDPLFRHDAAPNDHPGAYGQPEASMALELRNLRDPSAVPTLVRILRSAKRDFVRSCASQALEEMKRPALSASSCGSVGGS